MYSELKDIAKELRDLMNSRGGWPDGLEDKILEIASELHDFNADDYIDAEVEARLKAETEVLIQDAVDEAIENINPADFFNPAEIGESILACRLYYETFKGREPYADEYLEWIAVPLDPYGQ